jgi:hypothetical protein
METKPDIKDIKIYKQDWKILFDIRNEAPERYPRLADVFHELIESRKQVIK